MPTSDHRAEHFAEAAQVRREANRLKARRGLDPRDPEALSEEEEARLEALEEWEP